jgi:hypothetical protein
VGAFGKCAKSYPYCILLIKKGTIKKKNSDIYYRFN